MELVIASGPEDDPEREVLSSLVDPNPSQVRDSIYAPSLIHYGTHFMLSGSPAGHLGALCTSGPWAASGDRGELILLVDGEVVANGVSRECALDHLLLAFAR